MYSTYELLYLIFGGTSLAIGIIGNAIVIIYFGFKEKCKKNYDLLILILAIADFLTSVFNILFEWSLVYMRRWWLGKFGCIFMKFNGPSIYTAACYILVLMFYVRYRSISDPMNYNITKLKIIVGAVILLIMAVLPYIPYILNYTYEVGKCLHNYRVFNNDNEFQIYKIVVSFVCRFLIPFTVMIYIYYQTKRSLKQSSVELYNVNIDERNKRVLRTIFWLIVVFAVTVGPHSFTLTIDLIHKLNRTKKTGDWSSYMHYSCKAWRYLNSSANILIYAGNMPKFREFCFKIFLCRSFICREKHVTNKFREKISNTGINKAENIEMN